ncbi:MAG: cell division protein FtsL [Pelagibacterales bacterium]|nr:cell division protein FtsL [Pelagibacterales bacterium]
MRKLILLLSIFFLLIFTTIIKNSTKEIEKKIYNSKENLRVLKNKYEMVLMDFNYLTTPEKLMEYQTRYFENELDQFDIKKLKKITIKKNQLEIKEFIDFKKND